MPNSAPFDLGGKVAAVTGASSGFGHRFASDASRYMTAATIVVDGGRLVSGL